MVQVNVNPFLDSDFKNGMQLYSGVNLILSGVSIIIDLCAVTEVSLIFTEWNNDLLNFSPTFAYVILLLDIIVVLVQLYLGLLLYSSVMQNTYHKIGQWKKPSLVLFGIRCILIGCYWGLMPASAYFYSFTSITLLYSLFLFWPVSRYLMDTGCVPIIPLTETTRLLTHRK